MNEDVSPEVAALQNEVDTYQETDVFAWANNLVQYKDELKLELFFISKNYVLYKTALSDALKKQLEPIFVDEMLEYVLEGADKGLIVRGFEDAQGESGVLQRTQVYKVDKLRETLSWLKTQEREVVLFKEDEHDINHMKGVLVRVSHAEMDKPFYIAKVLPKSQVMKGKQGWMLRSDKFIPFDAEAALRLTTEPQLLVLDQDLYVFSEAKLKSLFGYDAKEASIAESKVREIMEAYNLSFAEGVGLQALLKGKKSLIKKLQKLEVGKVTQDKALEYAEDMDLNLMPDDAGRVIIMDEKDLTTFVNIINEDYWESPLTGERYEILSKRPLRQKDEDEIPEV